MAQRGPLVTAIVVVGGLVGLMTANAAGGLVTAGGPAPSPENAGATQSEQPPTAAQPPAGSETTAPPLETTTVPPTTTEEQPPPDETVFPAEAVYTGKAADIKLYIAVAVKGEEASAYLCDGGTTEVWLKGTAADGDVDLASADGAVTLTASLDANNALVGEFVLNGAPHDFSITQAPPPAGLYRGEDGQTTVGWIVMGNGQVVGVAKTPSGNVPAPALDPDEGGVTFRGDFLPAEPVTGETKFG
jgi:hypothetical protein